MPASRATRAQSGNTRTATPPGLTPAQEAAFSRLTVSVRNTATSVSTSRGRKTRNSSGIPARQENTRRAAPPSPAWITMAGGGGAFRGVFKMPDRTSDQGALSFELQLASNSTFTTAVTAISNVGRSWMVYMPEVTRFIRIRARYPDSPWSGWRIYGSPTSAASGATPGAGGGGSVPEPAPPPSDPVASPTEDTGIGGGTQSPQWSF